ncbi:MAG TPA: two-component sensor histidine kinase [Alphaproteobacteria bacterium]|nr:two-component sensor histidine kinase [Alphaproteobacteria bacterium]
MARLIQKLAGFQVKALLPKRLFGRSLIIVIAPIVLMQAVIAYIFFERHWDRVNRRLARAVASEISLLVETWQTLPAGVQFDTVADRAARTINLELAFLSDDKLPAEGLKTPFSVPAATLERELALRIAQPFWFDAITYEDYVDIRVQLPEGVLRVLAPRSRITSETAHIFILWMIGSSLVLLAIATIFLRNQVRPIAALAEAAEGFGKGRQFPNFKPAGAEEVRRASSAFIEMRDRIQRQIQQRTAMLAGVSHDLRTPITRMKLQLAMLPDSEEKEDFAADLTEMERMLEGYLAFARGQQAESVTNVDIAQLLDEIKTEALRHGAKIDISVTDGLHLQVRRVALKRCIVNLVENACSFGRNVRIRAERRDALVEVTVEDDGPGLAEADYDAAFRPFHRLDESRNQDRPGVGLGLAIARDVARSHGGDIVLSRSAALGGLRARLWLPV